MAERRYYWLKLPEDFFRDKRIKKLRKLAGGDTYTVIYLKLLLASMKDEGKIYIDGIEQDASEEIALDIDEDADNVEVTLRFLSSCGLACVGPEEVSMTELPKMVGSEQSSARRVREHREKQKALQCNTDVTMCNTDIDIDKEKDKEKDIDKDKQKRFTPPTLAEVQAYIHEKGYPVDAEAWIDHYTSNGWMVGRSKMKDWKAAVRTWARNGYNNQSRNAGQKGDRYGWIDNVDYTGMEHFS